MDAVSDAEEALPGNRHLIGKDAVLVEVLLLVRVEVLVKRTTQLRVRHGHTVGAVAAQGNAATVKLELLVLVHHGAHRHDGEGLLRQRHHPRLERGFPRLLNQCTAHLYAMA